MLPRNRMGRRIWGAAGVLLASVLSVLSARGLQKPVSDAAPPFRQKGEPGAPVVIVEYSDFQCPACRKAEEPLRSILSLYGKNVRILFKHFPLERVHPLARESAAASECAGRQGRFWEFHDLLYDRQGEWSQGASASERLLKYAREIGLDMKAFQACLGDPSVAAAIHADIEEGNNRWVSSTPTFFINRKRFAGAAQLSSRGTIWIDRILKK